MEYKVEPLDINKITAEIVDKKIESLFTKTQGLIKSKIIKNKIDLKTIYEPYLIKSYEKYSKVKTIIYKVHPVFIYDFFECNKLKFKDQIIDVNKVQTLFAVSNYTVIQGTGGIGKTTLMKHFFLNSVQETDYVPIFVELKDYKNEQDSLINIITSNLKNLKLNIEDKHFEYSLEKGCYTFLFDGLDEVNGNLYNKIIEEINSFSEKYSENRYIVSTRPNESLILLQKFALLDTIEFSKEQSIRLIENLEFDEDVKNRFINGLNTYLYRKHKSFASNPLLLTIMLLTFENYAEIPDKIHVFYNNAFETLFFKHDATKSGYKREKKSELTFDQFKFVFSYLSFKLYANNIYEFTYEELKQYLATIKGEKNIDFDVSGFISDLINSVCMLYYEGYKLKYTHRSFQEFFSALYLKELSDEVQIQAVNYLIDNGNEYLGKNQALNMLSDMATDRFHINILLPILKKIENSNPEMERYRRYFVYLVADIITTVDKSRLRIGVAFSDDLRTDFLVNFLLKEKINIPKNNMKYIETELIKRTKISKNKTLKLTSQMIISNDKYEDYFRMTWIGNLVTNAIRHYDQLSEKEFKFKNCFNEFKL